jgi:hypothetical protein
MRWMDRTTGRTMGKKANGVEYMYILIELIGIIEQLWTRCNNSGD